MEEDDDVFVLKEIFGFVVVSYTESRVIKTDNGTHMVRLPVLSNKRFTIVKLNNEYSISKNHKQLFITSDINELISYIDKHLSYLRVNQPIYNKLPNIELYQ